MAFKISGFGADVQEKKGMVATQPEAQEPIAPPQVAGTGSVSWQGVWR